MKKYVKIAYISRWLDPQFDYYQTCEWCNQAHAVDVDHIYGRLWNLLTDKYNLILLCRKCHQEKWWRIRQKTASLIVENILDR